MSQLSEQEEVRREAMNKLRDLGIDPYPAAEYVSTHYSETVKTIFEKKGDLKEISLSGRMMAKRIMGKASFAELKDKEGRIQLYFNRDEICPTDDKTMYNVVFKKLLDMGDFVGGMLKYLRKKPVQRLTISGGFAKMVKLAQGNLDLHSSRSQVDFEKLSQTVAICGGDDQQIRDTKSANTAKEVIDFCADLPLKDIIAKQARATALATLSGDTLVDVMIIDRVGNVISHVGQ